MIESKSTLIGDINAAQTISGALNNSVEYRYPELENLEVNPSAEKQVFNHPNSYGYDEVVVNAITGDTLEITPSKEEQTFNGVYTEVKSKGVTSEVDENIKAENIKGGVSILGVEGTLEAIDYWSTEPSTVTSGNFNLLNYLKELPRYIDISNWTGRVPLRITTLEKADLRLWNLSNITGIDFNGASKLKELNMNGCKIDKATNLDSLCYGCSSLERAYLKGLCTNKITSLNSMFALCRKLTTLDISDFDTSNVTSMSNMFRICQNLTSLDLSSFNTSKVTNMYSVFYNCYALTNLDIRNFTFDSVTSYDGMFEDIPADCQIIVKGDTEKEWVLARRSDLTNVKTVAELDE